MSIAKELQSTVDTTLGPIQKDRPWRARALQGKPVLTVVPANPFIEQRHSHDTELSAKEREHIRRTAEIIADGGIVAFPFNGVFGLFGNLDNPHAAELIDIAKGRPKDKKYIQVAAPETIAEVAGVENTPWTRDQVTGLYHSVHALGVILPASEGSAEHIVVTNEQTGERTVATMWTEYAPLRQLVEDFREMKGRALVGTSANPSGSQTHHRFADLANDFRGSVHALVEDDFSHLPAHRRMSTTMVDLTGRVPALIRRGNVPGFELQEALERNGFPRFIESSNVKTVQPRK